jgi:hypothetical protein
MLPPETEHPRDVWHALNSFLGELSNHLSASQLEKVLFNTAELSGSVVGGKPEAFTEDELIFPLLGSVDLQWRRQPGHDGPYQEWPDFELINTAIPVIGESKPVNCYKKAERDMNGYLSRGSFDTPYGIVTDGIDWIIVGLGVGEGKRGYEKIEHVSLRKALQFVAHRQGYTELKGARERSERIRARPDSGVRRYVSPPPVRRVDSGGASIRGAAEVSERRSR